jgi:hypothetical protein
LILLKIQSRCFVAIDASGICSSHKREVDQDLKVNPRIDSTEVNMVDEASVADVKQVVKS